MDIAVFFGNLASILAEANAEELEAKGGLLQSKDSYIAAKTKEITADLEKSLQEFFASLALVRPLLDEALSKLPLIEKNGFTKELGKINEDLLNPTLYLEGKSIQTILSLSDELLLWLYTTGYTHFQEGHFENAFGIFQLLTLLNPYVADYWLALGFAAEKINQVTALVCFSTAAELNPENLQAHFNKASLYHKIGKKEEALAILDKTDTSKEQNWKQAYAALKHTILNKG